MEDEQVEQAVDDTVPVPDRLLRSALEFAVGVAATGAKLPPPVASPDGLRPFLRMNRLPPAAFAKVRRAIDGDPGFLTRLNAVATPELVDEIGLHWLRRQPGWRSAIDDIAGGAERHRLAAAHREQRKRQAAEEAADKARAAGEVAQEQLTRERAARVRERSARERVEAELARAQQRVAEVERTLGALRDKVARLHSASEVAEEARAAAVARAEQAEQARDAVLVARAEALSGPPAPFDTDAVRRMHERAVQGVHDAERAMRELGKLLAEARPAPPATIADRLPRARRDRARRAPVPIPGGLFGDSAAVAEHLLRMAGVLVLVDGYNVAKLGWPTLELGEQRELTVGVAENVARRWGTAITIVFDGADAVGAAGAGARRLVRVIFSPPGVIADDVLRAEVGGASHGQPLVVVSNDQAVVADVRAEGANTLTSDQFLVVARR